jgi:stress response protein YsnF
MRFADRAARLVHLGGLNAEQFLGDHMDDMDDIEDDEAYDADDEDYVAGVGRHEALKQLDEWREEAESALTGKNKGKRTALELSDWNESVREEIVLVHGDEIEDFIEQLKDEKSRLDAHMDADRGNEVRPTQEALDRLDAVEDAIEELTHILEG